MKRVFFAILFFSLLFNSCQTRHNGSELQEIKMKKDEIPALIESNIKVSDILAFKNPSEGVLSFVWKVLKAENEYIIIDKHPDGGRVLRFSLEGKFMSKIGNMGRGPGEFMNALDVEMTDRDGSIYVLSEQGKILEYDLSGRFSEEYSSKYYSSSFGLNPSGNFYQYASSVESPNKHGIFEFDKKKNRYKMVLQKQSEWYPIEELNFFSFKERVFFREAFSNTIFEIREGEFIPLFRFDWPDKNYKIEYDKLDLFSVFEKMAFEGDFFPFRGMAINDHMVYASFGDELNQLTYHVIHYFNEGKTKAFFTENQDGFFVAMIFNESNQPGFFLGGVNLKNLAIRNPSLFAGLNNFVFSEDVTYLVFIDLDEFENH